MPQAPLRLRVRDEADPEDDDEGGAEAPAEVEEEEKSEVFLEDIFAPREEPEAAFSTSRPRFKFEPMYTNLTLVAPITPNKYFL